MIVSKSKTGYKSIFSGQQIFVQTNIFCKLCDHVNLLWIPHVDQRCLLNKELLTPWNLVDNLVGFSQVAQNIVVVDIDAHANKKQEVT